MSRCSCGRTTPSSLVGTGPRTVMTDASFATNLLLVAVSSPATAVREERGRGVPARAPAPDQRPSARRHPRQLAPIVVSQLLSGLVGDVVLRLPPRARV